MPAFRNVPKRRGSNQRSEAPAAYPVRFSQADAKRGIDREAVEVPRPRLTRATNLGQRPLAFNAIAHMRRVR